MWGITDVEHLKKTIQAGTVVCDDLHKDGSREEPDMREGRVKITEQGCSTFCRDQGQQVTS